jgi:hypothetical protein
MLRSIGAVILGYVTMAVVTLAVFQTIQVAMPGAFPDPYGMPGGPIVAIIFAMAVVAGAAGGFVLRLVARRLIFRHATALAAIMAILGIVSLVMNPADQPAWYQIATIVLGVAGMYAGALIGSVKSTPAA